VERLAGLDAGAARHHGRIAGVAADRATATVPQRAPRPSIMAGSIPARPPARWRSSGERHGLDMAGSRARGDPRERQHRHAKGQSDPGGLGSHDTPRDASHTHRRALVNARTHAGFIDLTRN